MANSCDINIIKAEIASNTDDVDMRNTLVKDLLDQGHISGLYVSEVDISSVPTVKKQPSDIAEFLAEKVRDPEYLAARVKSESRKGVLEALKGNPATPPLSVALIEMKEARRDNDESEFPHTAQLLGNRYAAEEMTVDEIVEFLNGSVKTLGAVNMGFLARRLPLRLRYQLRDADFGRPDVPTDDPEAATWPTGRNWLFDDTSDEGFAMMVRGQIAPEMVTIQPQSIELLFLVGETLTDAGDGPLDVDDVERLLAYADRLNFSRYGITELALSDAAEEYLCDEVLRLADATPDSVPAPATVTALGMALGVTGDSERQIRIRTGAAIAAAAHLRDILSGGEGGEATIRFHLMGRAVINDAEHLTDGEVSMLMRAVLTHRGTRYEGVRASAGFDLDELEDNFVAGADLLSRVDVDTAAAYICIASDMAALHSDGPLLRGKMTAPVFERAMEMLDADDVLGLNDSQIYRRCKPQRWIPQYDDAAFSPDASSDDRHIAERLLVLNGQNWYMLRRGGHAMALHKRLGGSMEAWEVFLSTFTEESTISDQIDTARLLVGLDMEAVSEPDQTVNNEQFALF